jgi:hypothetical protein
MNPPMLSLCIPTYNRARYLDSLLSSLVLQLQDFPYAYELVISDNACTDDTAQVVERHAQALPIRYLRHAQGIGCYPNMVFALTQARGRYVMYLADDDCVLGAPLADTVAAMEADPQTVVTYAPWLLYDLVAQQEQGQFYRVPHDLCIARDQQAELLDHVLRYRIVPEIYVARTEVMKRLMPRVDDIAFFAFTQAADYLTQGAVRIRQQPFYVSITRYFEGETRSQVGNGEVELAWDRYRGGLEYMMARAGDRMGAEERAGFHLRVQQMIAERMAAAIRLRHAQGKDPQQTHRLAMRVKGMGYEQLLPVPLAVLAAKASLHFLLNDAALHRGMQRLVCIGPFDAEAQAYLQHHAAQPVEFHGLTPQPALQNALLFVSAATDFSLGDTDLHARNLQMVREPDLCERFNLLAA